MNSNILPQDLTKNGYYQNSQMLTKIINDNGQKARQRSDKEDRSLPYRNWLRQISRKKSIGYCCDLDMIHYRSDREQKYGFKPFVVTDLTLWDKDPNDIPGQAYLQAIINRYFYRDAQGKMVSTVAEILGVPAFLILHPSKINWLWIYSFQQHRWKLFTPEQWSDYLAKI